MSKRQHEQIDMFPDSPETLRIKAARAAELRCRIEDLLRNTAVEIRTCRGCSELLFIAPNLRTKRLVPYEADGTNHFQTCPKAAEFSAKPQRGTKP